MAPVPGVDPLFTDEDFEELIEYLEWKDSLCPQCGEPKHESFAAENSYAYRAATAQCHSCATTARAVDKLDDRSGVFTFLTKRPGTDPS